MAEDRNREEGGLEGLMMRLEPVQERIFSFFDADTLMVLCRVSSWLRRRATQELTGRDIAEAALPLSPEIIAWANLEAREIPLRVVLLCGCATGKTTLMSRVVHKEWVDNHEATIGSAFHTMKYDIPGVNQAVKMDFWDTAGQERYRPMYPMYLRGSMVNIVFVDCRDPHTVDEAEYWMTELEKYNTNRFICVTKIDLGPDPKVMASVESLSRKFHIHVVKTSAKTGKGEKGFIRTAASLALAQAWKKAGEPQVKIPAPAPAKKRDCILA